MRKSIIAIAGVLTVCVLNLASAQTPSTASATAHTRYAERVSNANPTPMNGSLAGLWTAPRYEVPLNSDLDVSVWGRNVSYRRDVDLAIEPSGEGILTVRTAVVDSRGRAKPASVSIEEARIRLEMPAQVGEGRMDPEVTVLSAERRYPDDPEYRPSLDGLVVKVSTVAGDPTRINIRLDTPEGRGSFGETLTLKRRASNGAR